MSRRKQLNPKPLLKNEVEIQECLEEITVDPDNKVLCNNDKSPSGMDKKLTFSSVSKVNDEILVTQSTVDTKNDLDDTKESSNSRLNNSTIPKQRLLTSIASEPAIKLQVNNFHNVFEDSITQDIKTNKSILEDSTSKNVFDISQKVKVFFCNPCGIGFSSASTLEAHQAYYCSHRRDLDEDPQFNSISSNDKNFVGESLNKSQKTGKQYACLQCSYSADKKVSLNRHMRMHQISPTPSSNASNGDDNSSQHIDRYCSECDIKFSNTKTYRAHKLHYCNTRRSEITTSPKTDSSQKETLSPDRRSNSPQLAQLIPPFLALPTYPVLVIPYSLIQNASIISDPLTLISSGSNLGTCYSLENGSLKTLATAITTNHKSNDNTDLRRKIASTSATMTESPEKITKFLQKDLQKKICKENSNRETIPLDLSLRRVAKSKKQIIKLIDNKLIDLDTFIEGKENLSNNQESSTPEHIICAPSLPNSPSLSPSPKRRILSPKIDTTISNLEVDSLERIALTSVLKTDKEMKLVYSNVIPSNSKKKLELEIYSEKKFTNITNAASSSSNMTVNVNVPSSASSNSSPHIYVKQGVSKCKECNIVFCKHENYLVHKQHYCSSRNLEDQDKKVISVPGSQIKDCSGAISTVAYQQLICAACGIKYTSLDNLRAHQSYYCPKGGEKVAIEKKCEICKTFHDISNPCPENSETLYKCPVCDFSSMSASENRKHLESHESVKAFRCTVCRYKGNTLRGMRTHIRMHFDKKKTDFNEESYMSCIFEEDGFEINASNNLEQPQNLSQQLYNCDICNYSSSYKGNVLRHTKLVHAEEELTELSEGNLLSNQTGHNNEIVKLEPLEHHNSNNIKAECEEQTEFTTESVHSRIAQLLDDENNIQKSSAQKYCETCDIKFNYMKTYIAHKQFYCKSKSSENENSSPISIQSPSLLNRNKENMETII